MQLGDILADLYRTLNYQSSPASAVTTRLTSYINRSQEDILGDPGHADLLKARITFASVSAQSEYALPPSISRLLSIQDTANLWRLTRVEESYARTVLADPSRQNGTPQSYAEVGRVPFGLRPSTADKVYAVSSSAGDTTQNVKWQVITSTGAIITGSTALNGVTAVQLGTSAAIVDVVDAYLDAVCAGTVTFTQTNGAGATLSTINIGNFREWYLRVMLLPTPASALTYTVDYERHIIPLANPTDEPTLPGRFQRVLIWGALCLEYIHLGDQTRLVMAKREYENELGQINMFLSSPPDQLTIPGRSMTPASNMPAYYPWSGFRSG